MRSFRLSLYFLFGLVLGGCSVLAFAETVPAVPSGVVAGRGVYLNAGPLYFFDNNSMVSACTFLTAQMTAATAGSVVYSYKSVSGYECYYLWKGQDLGQHTSIGTANSCGVSGSQAITSNCALTCTLGQNWTLSGSTCTRADCVSPQVRNDSDGTCTAPPNPCVSGASSSASWYSGRVCNSAQTCLGSLRTVPTTMCDGQCSGTVGDLTNATIPANSVGYVPVVITAAITLNGSQCSGGNGAAPEVPSSTCSSQGMCGGLVNGVQMCVSCDTSTQQQTTTTTPSGTSTGSVITSCTAAGSCSSTVNNGSSSTTVTGAAPSNGRGTAISDGQGNYKLELPTDYQRDATGQSLNDKAQKILDMVGGVSGDDSGISSAGASDSAKQSLSDSDKSVRDLLSGAVGEVSGVTSSASVWSQTMLSSWYAPLTLANCLPFDSQIGAFSWNLNICPTAAKISEIGAYVMWMLLMFAGFRLLTAPRRAEV